ncbi:MAG: hypothetical protein CFH10_01293 [Alphaproteobacteria bacterium MarineAlpha4_Bin2]|nr:MAG: hypothetical protein CFH10_01293 [Alphaproteobacteria bacterium MarineAlpha4_Bin2]
MQALKALVITLGVLILIAFGFLVYGVATNFSGGEEGSVLDGSFGETQISIPAGSRILDATLGSGRVVVRVVKLNGDEALVLIDAATGKRRGLIHLNQEPPR